jgi:CHAT domain-containing protein
MSIEEAKKVTVSMSDKSFIPPPRRIDDILTVLEEPGKFDPEIIEKHKTMADALPPDTKESVILAKFYYKRGASALEIGRSKQALEDLRRALLYAEKEDGKKATELAFKDYAKILAQLGNVEASYGNYKRAISLQQNVIEKYPRSQSYFLLTLYYLRTGDFKGAEKVKNEGVRFCNEMIPKSEGQGEAWLEIHKAGMQSAILEAKGKYFEAEGYRRFILEYMAQPSKKIYTIKKFPRAYLMRRCTLAYNLIKQGRFIEAELEVRETLKESIGLCGKEATTTGAVLVLLGKTLLSQGRLDDADKIIYSAFLTFENSGLSRDSFRMGRAIMILGQILVAKLEFPEAMKQFDDIRQCMQENKYFYEKYITQDPNFILTLLKAGHTQEAMESISNRYHKYIEYLGNKNYKTAEILALRGMANALMGKEKQAIKDFSDSVPILFHEKSGEFDYLENIRLKIIVEAYLELLTIIHKSEREKKFEINASAEMFRLCEEIRGSTVQSALGASGARAAAVNPELADLVRREQDAFKQINALKATLFNAFTEPSDQQNSNALEDLKGSIDTLSKARAVLLYEIKRRFPKYSAFTKPQPVTLIQAQRQLKPNEALISVYPSENQTFVWAIPHKGKTKFTIVPLKKNDLHKIVNSLRKSLDPNPETFGDFPDFDFNKAYELYSKLLKPVESGWKDAKDLLVVATGPLGQLAFSVLPTASIKIELEKNELFANYRKIPWLIRKVSITRCPSVFSFITLRKLPPGNSARKHFVGFGDPYFNQEQLTQAYAEKISQKAMTANRGGRLHVRGIRVTKTGNLDSEKITSSNLGLLNRLPDTAEEIKSIARALDADLTKDIFLGENASELRVKNMDLSDRRVVAFATHALVPGDLDGLDQPAIALSAPTVTGYKEDGLLKMEEVLKLKLNADWVVLSACNTGAADGAGAEAVSGLGRAFFYAGTRAILVSMWPVETTSAKKLTTGLFIYQKENPKLSRARALQKSILSLIDGPGIQDDVSGKIIASYAHPLFWAPFIIVGEGGGDVKY